MEINKILFTQYLRPCGCPIPITIDRPEEIANKARQLSKDGYEFECEVLQTGEISLSISKGGEDWDVEICDNGPEVPFAVDRLIEGFTLPIKEQP